MNYKKYLIKKKELDLLSSLKSLKLFTKLELFKEYEVKNLEELKNNIMDQFEKNLSMCDFIETREYFRKILKNENNVINDMNYCDVQEMTLFVYKEDNEYHYYIPKEIKRKLIEMLIL